MPTNETQSSSYVPAIVAGAGSAFSLQAANDLKKIQKKLVDWRKNLRPYMSTPEKPNLSYGEGIKALTAYVRGGQGLIKHKILGLPLPYLGMRGTDYLAEEIPGKLLKRWGTKLNNPTLTDIGQGEIKKGQWHGHHHDVFFKHKGKPLHGSMATHFLREMFTETYPLSGHLKGHETGVFPADLKERLYNSSQSIDQRFQDIIKNSPNPEQAERILKESFTKRISELMGPKGNLKGGYTSYYIRPLLGVTKPAISFLEGSSKVLFPTAVMLALLTAIQRHKKTESERPF